MLEQDGMNNEERGEGVNTPDVPRVFVEAFEATASCDEGDPFTFELPDDGPRDVEEAFGEHDIDYWVWDGNRLIPASPQKRALIREREALQRLREWPEREQWASQARGRPAWRARLAWAPSLVGSIYAWCVRQAYPLKGKVHR